MKNMTLHGVTAPRWRLRMRIREFTGFFWWSDLLNPVSISPPNGATLVVREEIDP